MGPPSTSYPPTRSARSSPGTRARCVSPTTSGGPPSAPPRASHVPAHSSRGCGSWATTATPTTATRLTARAPATHTFTSPGWPPPRPQQGSRHRTPGCGRSRSRAASEAPAHEHRNPRPEEDRMASVDSQIPNWPIAEAVVHADGSATLTIGGTQQAVAGHDPAAARSELVRLVREQLAVELRRPVRLRTVDPDGSEGQLAIAPDGTVSELSARTRPRVAATPAPPTAAPPEPPQLHVAEAAGPPVPAPYAGERGTLGLDWRPAPRELRRGEVHHRQPSALHRSWRWITDELLVSAGEKAERAEDTRLKRLP